MAYRSYPGSRTARTNSRTAALPSPLNNDLPEYHLPDSSILKEKTAMKDSIINTVISEMSHVLNPTQLSRLQEVMASTLVRYQIAPAPDQLEETQKDNLQILEAFLSSKRVEGCSEKTEKYYRSTILQFLSISTTPIQGITTDDLRQYLSDCQSKRSLSKVTIDNMRRIFSSFFSWLEDEDYIIKSPVRRIHRVRTDSLIKETISDETLELLRDNCDEIRDLALIDMLSSTGVRVGELVQLNRSDINLQERQCVVFGKGNKEREVYFSARAKIHLQSYLNSRTDDNPALFVSLKEPFNRLSISGVEVRLRTLGKRVQQQKIHPHKFRRTLATFAIDKGMPIEQVQKLLGHVKIDTTMHYAMVNQTNVKMAHRKFLG